MLRRELSPRANWRGWIGAVGVVFTLAASIFWR